ncbi:hypothetical protein EMPS_06087 [Entomortierella parvispora]|uniref:TLC domain-containing protein n=1 Tax=Entomortierella parvispora TaxID=205924 RepID=A0A9P3HBN1_9FUNG|nr:hypothetical protein EMPS_06087 [Entomortierella parvispora]
MDSHPLQSAQEALRLLDDIASNQGATFTAYEKFLGIELNPYNVVFLKTIPIAFIMQFVLFYPTWYFVPSLTTNRRGLAWVATFYCACFMFSLSLLEIGQLRCTIFDYLGLDSTSLGLPPSATVFSHWMPALHQWAMQLGSSANGQQATFVLCKLGDVLRWFIAQPLFSLAPLKPVLTASPDRPFFWGGGGRLLVSFENYPRDSMTASLICGYFIGYALGDQVLSYAHYRDQVGILTGDIHHAMYSIITLSMCRVGALSIFAVIAGMSECSTVFLCWGYMFPKLKSDFWFSVFFFGARIFFNFVGVHELAFNVGPAGGAAYIYAISFVMHSFWFSKFVRIQMYKARKRAKEQLEQTQKQQEDGSKALSSSGSTETSGQFKSSDAPVIQLRASAEKKRQ